MIMLGRVSFALVAACSLAVAVPPIAEAQNISVDGRFSPAMTLNAVGGNYAISANLGKQVGTNLFHSFGKFGLVNGETAAFTPNGSTGPISNVIGRVTGGAPSNINGQIRSTDIPGANLYLINPSGIVFGPNATVNVSGSFHASTADYVRMADGARFQATNPDGSTLSAAAPAAFGFLTARPTAITVNGSTLGPVPGTLGLAAGPVTISGGTLQAPAGTIHVTAVNGTGEVPTNPRDASALTVTSFGQVDVNSRSTLDASTPAGPGSGGSVFIRSGALTIDASAVAANNAGPGPGGQLVLRGDNQITLSNGAAVQAFASGSGSGAGVIISTAPSGRVVVDASTVSALTTSTAANAGPGGTISIVAEELALHNGANVLAASCITPTCDLAGATAGAGGGVAVSLSGSLAIDSGASLGTFTRGTGNAGNVSVTAVGPVTIDRGAHTSTLAGIGSRTGGQGNAGIVAVRAGALTLTNNGLVASVTLAGAAGNSGDVSVDVSGPLSIAGSSTGITGTTFSLGKGGDVTVNAGSITIGNSGSISSDAASSGAASSGNAGAVRITAGSLKIASSGEITSGTSGRGASGSVSVSVAGELAIDGAMTLANATTGIFSQANGGSTGDAGEVSVNAGSIFIINSGTISSGTFGRGNGGSVSVNVAGRLAIDGAMTPVSFTGISSQANRGSIGNAGPISITAGSVSLAHGGEISSTTFARGRGGTVAVAVDGLLAIDGSGTNPGATGIQTDSRAGSSGNAGDISVRAGALSLVHGGVISSALRPFMNLPPSTGNSGRITINVGGLLSISGSGSRIGTETNPGSIGDAGSITVDAAQITIASGGQIASSTAGAGKGGIVDVSADSDIVLRDPGPQIRAQSTGSGDAGSITIAATRLLLSDRAAISTEAATSTANGGNITLHVRDFLHLVSSEISTSVKGETGNGGNITIDPQLVILDHHSLIKADAIAGHGGNITITAGQFIPSSDSSVEATSELGISGTIVINGPRVDVNGALVVLSSQLRGRTEVLREACAARSDRPISSLVEAGRGGLPQDPEATLPALYLAGRDVNPNPQAGADATQASSAPLRTTVRLTMRCG